MILDHFNENGHFGPLWGTSKSDSLLSKVTIYLPLTQGPSRDLLKTLLFWPNFLSPFWTLLRVLEGTAARARDPWAAFGLEDLLRSLTNPCPGPQIFFWPLFLLKKSIFVILPIRGQWKCHFDPILTPFWALLSPNLGLLPKCAYLFPLPGWGPWRGPQGPQIWPYFDHFGPFWGSWRRLQLGPIMSCLWAGGPAQSLSNPCPGPTNFGHLTTFPIEKVNFCHFAYQGSVKMPFWPYFDPILSPPEPEPWPPAKMCLFFPTAQGTPLRTLRDPKFDPNFGLFDTPLAGVLEGVCS